MIDGLTAKLVAEVAIGGLAKGLVVALTSGLLVGLSSGLAARLVGVWMEGCLKLITGLFARLITGPSVGMVDALTRGLTADITARTAAGSGTGQAGGLAGRPFAKMAAELI